MQTLEGKKLLILGGVFQHCKLVEAAKELGVITYVTDHLPPEQAPAKQMADRYFMHNIMNVDDIVAACKSEGIDGVISTSLDACQLPYQSVCEALGFPCFGTREQYRVLTDKTAFKAFCRQCGVDVIPEYAAEDFVSAEQCARRVSFPILIKPCDSRGSRGQSICRTYEEAVEGIAFARAESALGKIVIEQYMGQNNDFSMTIIVVNGKAYPFRTVDRILGRYEDGLDKLAVGAIMPSVFTDLYMKRVHESVERFIAELGLVNAPVFMQGFVDGDTVCFYDPGLRFPGGEYERMFKAACGKDLFYPLIEYALTGRVSEDAIDLTRDAVWLNNKMAVQVLPPLRPGTIASVEGWEAVRRHPRVVSAFERYAVGDTIRATKNVNQRFAEIDVVCDTAEEMAAVVAWIYETLHVRDEHGEDMIVSRCDPAVFLAWKDTMKTAMHSGEKACR